MRIPGVAQLGAVSALVLLTAWLLAPIPFLMEPTAENISVEQAGSALGYLRRSLVEDDLPAWPRDLASVGADRLPLVLTVWKGGARRRVWQVDDRSFEEALEILAGKLRADKREIEGPSLRLQLDLVMATGWVPQGGTLFSLSFVEGHTGVSGIVDGRRVYLPPSEFIRQRKYGSFQPLPGYDARFRIGVDIDRIKRTIRHQATVLGSEGESVTDLERFLSLTFVEGADLVPRRLLKGTVERDPVTRADLEAAVNAGADYLLRALRPSGMYFYNYDPVADRKVNDAYNWPRHAGTTYSLALVGRILERPDLVNGAARALGRLERQLDDGPDGSLCLLAKGECYLGSSALGLLALAEYRLASGDDRFDESAFRVRDYIVSMQRPDGLFYHVWKPDTGIDREKMKLYASQQAVFALGRFAAAYGDKKTLDVAGKGMDFLAGPYWNHFLGSYFFGQEHWSCLAAQELYEQLHKPKYARYCHGIGVNYDNLTHGRGETPFVEDVGGMSITHFFTPHTGGTATAAEAMVSAVILGKAEGLDVDPIAEQLVATYGFLLKGQVSDHDTFWMRRPRLAIGGFYESQTKTRIRIDNVQHAISAIVRGMDLVGLK